MMIQSSPTWWSCCGWSIAYRLLIFHDTLTSSPGTLPAASGLLPTYRTCCNHAVMKLSQSNVTWGSRVFQKAVIYAWCLAATVCCVTGCEMTVINFMSRASAAVMSANICDQMPAARNSMCDKQLVYFLFSLPKRFIFERGSVTASPASWRDDIAEDLEFKLHGRACWYVMYSGRVWHCSIC